jgi:hypothetical protein
VLHNDPPHPLQIPLAVTLLFEIKDEPATVRQTLDGLCRAWQKILETGWNDKKAESKSAAGQSASRPVKRPGQSGVSLVREDDGLWYIRFGTGGPAWLGLAGPAWTVTDRFIVASWSPMALREYLDKIGAAAGKRE